MFNREQLQVKHRDAQAQAIYQFGSYSLNVLERTLMREGEKVHLKPKTFDLLTFLFERTNQVATKDEIFESVWQGAFVEEANLAVHISSLRKVFSSDKDPGVVIETVPRIGYRLKTEFKVLNPEKRSKFDEVQTSEQLKVCSECTDSLTTDTPKDVLVKDRRRQWGSFTAGVVVTLLVTGAVHFTWEPTTLGWWNGKNRFFERVSDHTIGTAQCPRDSISSNLEVGGCEEAVSAMNYLANPYGNWSFGFTTIDEPIEFKLFDHADHRTHFATPEAPTDIWRQESDWHPLVLRNISGLHIVVQGLVIVHPTMLELHPGKFGERSVVRWTAPASGFFHFQGQFRGINLNGDTSTDIRIIQTDRAVLFDESVNGFNVNKPFNFTVKLFAGETIDFSVGYGSNKDFSGDSTGFSATVTTISFADRTNASP